MVNEFNAVLIPFLSEVIEFIGVVIIAVAIGVGVYNLVIKNKFKFDSLEKNPVLNQGLSVALEIILAAEILKTLMVRTPSQILELGALIFIRLLMTVILHWELNEKEKTLRLEEIKSEKQGKENERKIEELKKKIKVPLVMK